MRMWLIAMVFFLLLLPLKAGALTRVSDVPKEKTLQQVLEEILDITTDLYDNEVFCQSVCEQVDGYEYPFLVYPKQGTKYPSNIPIIINGHYPKDMVKVRIWDVTNPQNHVFFKKADFVYQTNYMDVKYNLHLQNNKKYQVRVYVGGKLVLSHWFVETIDRDEHSDPPIKPIRNDSNSP